jgi:hypothetical protein
MHPTGTMVLLVEPPDKVLFTVVSSMEKFTWTAPDPVPQSAVEGPRQPARSMLAMRQMASVPLRMLH